jgi:hypothetical protein
MGAESTAYLLYGIPASYDFIFVLKYKFKEDSGVNGQHDMYDLNEYLEAKWGCRLFKYGYCDDPSYILAIAPGIHAWYCEFTDVGANDLIINPLWGAYLDAAMKAIGMVVDDTLSPSWRLTSELSV